MPDFLLEIGCEEIPARMLLDGQNALGGLSPLLLAERLIAPDQEIRESLEDQGGSYGRLVAENLTLLSTRSAFSADKTQLFSTPRRIAFFYPGLLSVQPDIEENVIGPAVRVAYKDGKPTQAAEAFAKRVNLPVERVGKIVTPKGEYLSATVTKKGRPAAEVLAEIIPKHIARIYWAKAMYWRSGKPERFVRPIRWLVALLDSDVIPLEVAGIQAGRKTRGHRLLSKGEKQIAKADRYSTVMAKAFVLAGYQEREQRIRKALDAATRHIPGARWREDAELLNTVVNLTEWPSAVLGRFDKQFLSLPEEILVTVMRDHQKYFAVEDAKGKLAPCFLAVLNTDGDPDGLIRHGNERVLRARFNDAQFFWDFDNRTPFADRREMLKHVTFQRDLGNYFDKTDRLVGLVDFLRVPGRLSPSGLEVDRAALVRAATLAKNDLTTELVKEFTELQGIIGGLYTRYHGEPQKVADAIYDQYKPKSAEDSVPRSLEGAILSVADKADSVAGMFALNLIPSGSKDPFALRRQANGMIKIIAHYKWQVSIDALMTYARAGYRRSEAESKFTLGGTAYDQAINVFFRERLEFYLRDVLGVAYDVVNATLAGGADDVVDAVARAHAVAKVRPSADFESISIAFKRMKNILRQAGDENKRVAPSFDIKASQADEERSLDRVSRMISDKVKELSAAKQYDEALLEIAKLRRPIDAFFDKVMVMVEDEALRANRLGLLQTLVREFSSVADFSEIVTEGK